MEYSYIYKRKINYKSYEPKTDSVCALLSFKTD